jgi:hypothetical protein
LGLAQAAQLDAEAKVGKFRGPLHGVPLALKDNIDTAGTRTTGGSAVFDDRVPAEEGFVVRRLKEAGAVILAKANLQEFAMGNSSASTYFRPVRNPWALERIPAGLRQSSLPEDCQHPSPQQEKRKLPEWREPVVRDLMATSFSIRFLQRAISATAAAGICPSPL